MRKAPGKNRAASVKAKHHSNLTFRMNILFFAIFIVFSMLIFRLGYMQIVKGEEYVRLLESTEEVPVNTSVPRGRMYDRYGRILVDNHPENAITYTKMQTTTTDEMLNIAEKLAQLIEQPTKRVTLRDKQDFWIIKNHDAAYDKVTKAEEAEIRAKENITTSQINAEVDKLVRERITNEELLQLSEKDLEVLAIFREMTSGYNLSPQIIKSENVSAEEFARVSERLTELPGVNTTTDWKRVKLSSLSILGRTTVPTKGIPKEKLNYYLARDYSRNDRVGESYIEAQYEELLQGQKTVVKNITNKKGQVVDTITTYEGEPGKDLILSLDSELQAETEKIVEEELLNLKALPGSYLLDRAFLIMMDPNTGDVLYMVGKKIEKNPETGKSEIVDYGYGTFTTAYEAGSSVKAATVLTGYNQDVISMGTSMGDEPIKLAGTDFKSSIFNRSGYVPMNDLMALERSSNSYMFKIALLINRTPYSYGMPLRLKDAGKTGTAEVVYYGPLREHFGTNTINLTHVGFAPYENPEIAYAVVIPWATTNMNQHLVNNNLIARRSLDKYFELKAKYEAEKVTDSKVNQPILPAITEEKIGEDEQE